MFGLSIVIMSITSAPRMASRACRNVGSQTLSLSPSITSWRARLLPPVPWYTSGSKPCFSTRFQYISHRATAQLSPTACTSTMSAMFAKVSGLIAMSVL